MRPVKGVSAGSATERERKVFDREAALRRIEGAEDLLAELAMVFAEDSEADREQIRRGMEHGDWDEVVRRAHKLKGSLGALSAQRARDAAEGLERAAKRVDPVSAHEWAIRLEERLEELLPVLRALAG